MTRAPDSLSVAERFDYNLSSNTQVTLHPLIIQVDGDQYIVGRVETGTFAALPEAGVQVIDVLQRVTFLGEAQAQLKQIMSAEVDLEKFIADLVELGFIEAINGYSVTLSEPLKPNLSWLQACHVQWLFRRPMLLIYFALLFAVGLTLARYPALLPHHEDFFWIESTSLNLLGNTVLILSMMLMHELAHLVAARSLNVPARIELGTRLHNLVMQTDVTGLWAQPRRQRYRVYLAGMMWDSLVLSTSILLLAYLPLPIEFQHVFRALALLMFLNLTWQFELFMRTDLYFVLMDLLRCYNLYNDALDYLYYNGWRLLRRIASPFFNVELHDPSGSLPDREQHAVRFYSLMVLVGSAISLSVFTVYGIPILVELFLQGANAVSQGLTLHRPGQFLDGVVTLLIVGGFQLLFLVTFLRNHKGWFVSLARMLARPS